MVGQIIFASAILLDGILHIFSLIKKNNLLRSVTKLLICPLVFGLFMYSYNYEKTSIIGNTWYIILVGIALTAGLIGDFLLLPDDKKSLPKGGVCFAIEQAILCFILFININLNNAPLALLIALPVTYGVIEIIYSILVVKKINHADTFIFLCSASYLALNAVNASWAIINLISNQNIKGIFMVIGTTLFLISDMILFYVQLNDKPRIDRRHIIIMITYIIAQSCLLYGLA